MIKKYFIILSLIPFLFNGCQNKNNSTSKMVTVNFHKKDSINKHNKNIENDTLPLITVAVSSMISPRETFDYYKELLNYISKKNHLKIEIKQRKTYNEVNNMLVKKNVDIAFICSGAYTKVKDINAAELLVVPVCKGKVFYQAYIIANKSSGIYRFDDFRGKSFAFTDPLSNTGKLYAIKRLKDIGSTPEQFFSSTVFTHAHDISIQLVSKELVDGATVDGLIYEYIASYYPERLKNIRIIEKSEYLGIPPIVVPSSLSPKIKMNLKRTFLSMHKDSIGKLILKKLLIDKFVEGDDSNYNAIRTMQKFELNDE